MWMLVCCKRRIKLQHDFQIHLNALLTQFIMWLQLRSYALCLELYKQALFQETLSIKPLLILSEGSLKQYWPGYFCQHLFIPSDIFFLILSLIPEIKASCMKVLTMHSRRGKSGGTSDFANSDKILLLKTTNHRRISAGSVWVEVSSEALTKV